MSLSQTRHDPNTKDLFGNMQTECFLKYEKYVWNSYSEINKYLWNSFSEKITQNSQEKPCDGVLIFCNIAGKTIFTTILLLINVF